MSVPQVTDIKTAGTKPAVNITVLIIRSVSESLNPVHDLEQRTYIVLVDWERRIVGRHTPDEVGVVIVVIAALNHSVVICNQIGRASCMERV